MKEIMPLLERLADQLGTSSEHLWRILLKQAPISATIDLVLYVFVILACVVWWKMTKFVHKQIDKSWDEINYMWIAIGWVILVALLIVIFICINNTITGFLHPEYWALDKILDTIKPATN